MMKHRSFKRKNRRNLQPLPDDKMEGNQLLVYQRGSGAQGYSEQNKIVSPEGGYQYSFNAEHSAPHDDMNFFKQSLFQNLKMPSAANDAFEGENFLRYENSVNDVEKHVHHLLQLHTRHQDSGDISQNQKLWLKGENLNLSQCQESDVQHETEKKMRKNSRKSKSRRGLVSNKKGRVVDGYDDQPVLYPPIQTAENMLATDINHQTHTEWMQTLTSPPGNEIKMSNILIPYEREVEDPGLLYRKGEEYTKKEMPQKNKASAKIVTKGWKQENDFVDHVSKKREVNVTSIPSRNKQSEVDFTRIPPEYSSTGVVNGSTKQGKLVHTVRYRGHDESSQFTEHSGLRSFPGEKLELLRRKPQSGGDSDANLKGFASPIWMRSPNAENVPFPSESSRESIKHPAKKTRGVD